MASSPLRGGFSSPSCSTSGSMASVSFIPASWLFRAAAARDAWFIGFTADYVTGVWMGYDDNTPLSGVTGGGLPAEIWREAMVRIHEGKPIRPLPMNLPQQVAQPVIPRTDGSTSTASSGNQPRRQPAPVRQDNIADRILKEVGGLFGLKY